MLAEQKSCSPPKTLLTMRKEDKKDLHLGTFGWTLIEHEINSVANFAHSITKLSSQNQIKIGRVGKTGNKDYTKRLSD